ncbi:cerebral dopamine neurotrophic factor [Leucoraja erinacea]|uniref:cerebral dopamine neurotrophic factor n=1 Tax=Leucoraja erinaceus TaxID=7782 RepID=UPI002456616A|nr:cerebral dopamine neurotrophic factor [Leucoraja erinacea]
MGERRGRVFPRPRPPPPPHSWRRGLAAGAPALLLLLQLLVLPLGHGSGFTCGGRGGGLGPCEVCLGFLERFYKYLKAQDVELTPEMVARELLLMCEHTKGKENRLCYYIGATSDAATKIVNEVARPMSAHVPVPKICEKLNMRDGQICELKYGKKLNLNKADLSRLRVADLKRILDNWGEKCLACAEKIEFINLILELAPLYQSQPIDLNSEL